MRYSRGSNHIWLGRAVVDWRAHAPIGRRIDGCSVTVVESAGGGYRAGKQVRTIATLSHHFGGLIVARKNSEFGVAFGWRNRRMLSTKWFDVRYVARRIKWRLTGSPPPLTTGACYEPAILDPAELEAAVVELQRIAGSL